MDSHDQDNTTFLTDLRNLFYKVLPFGITNTWTTFHTKKFLGFYLTERGIEVDPNMCHVVIDMAALKLKQGVQYLNRI
ncbi:hypothetical protein MTR_5g056420 [Medicago truncatula]|uniref:Uncharacterized protein n=1 Tax=Medicago truncatula TaxID=3880 RepID=G7K1J2_MEDTR|nr:hypothetical protein MTR_5g056420 [Medicago truncatula]